MKPEAIQNERDRIGSTKRNRKRCFASNTMESVDETHSNDNDYFDSQYHFVNQKDASMQRRYSLGNNTEFSASYRSFKKMIASTTSMTSPDQNSESSSCGEDISLTNNINLIDKQAITNTPNSPLLMQVEDGSKKLISMLINIEASIEANTINANLQQQKNNRINNAEEDTSKFCILKYLISWSNSLHPLPDLPFTDKVKFIAKIKLF